jgi:hypothetical protein
MTMSAALTEGPVTAFTSKRELAGFLRSRFWLVGKSLDLQIRAVSPITAWLTRSKMISIPAPSGTSEVVSPRALM